MWGDWAISMGKVSYVSDFSVIIACKQEEGNLKRVTSLYCESIEQPLEQDLYLS